MSKLQCKLCNKKLSSSVHLEKHMKTIHQPKLFICDFDGKQFNTKDKLRLHIFNHRKYYKIKCEVCDREYRTNQSMRKHLRTHFQQHQCDHCGQIFSYKRLLENHIAAVHEDLQEFQCKFCTRLFPNTTTRDNHQKLIHKNQEQNSKVFKCTECAAGFEMKEELRLHSFIHFNGEIHTCLDCNQIFKKKKLLTLHMKKHEVPSFSCEVCKQMFKYKSNLNKHLKRGRCKGNNEKDGEEKLSEEVAKIAKQQMMKITKNYSRSIVKPDDNEESKEKFLEPEDDECGEKNKTKIHKNEEEKFDKVKKNYEIEEKKFRKERREIKNSDKTKRNLKNTEKIVKPKFSLLKVEKMSKMSEIKCSDKKFEKLSSKNSIILNKIDKSSEIADFQKSSDGITSQKNEILKTNSKPKISLKEESFSRNIKNSLQEEKEVENSKNLSEVSKITSKNYSGILENLAKNSGIIESCKQEIKVRSRKDLVAKFSTNEENLNQETTFISRENVFVSQQSKSEGNSEEFVNKSLEADTVRENEEDPMKSSITIVKTIKTLITKNIEENRKEFFEENSVKFGENSTNFRESLKNFHKSSSQNEEKIDEIEKIEKQSEQSRIVSTSKTFSHSSEISKNNPKVIIISQKTFKELKFGTNSKFSSESLQNISKYEKCSKTENFVKNLESKAQKDLQNEEDLNFNVNIDNSKESSNFGRNLSESLKFNINNEKSNVKIEKISNLTENLSERSKFHFESKNVNEILKFDKNSSKNSKFNEKSKEFVINSSESSILNVKTKQISNFDRKLSENSEFNEKSQEILNLRAFHAESNENSNFNVKNQELNENLNLSNEIEQFKEISNLNQEIYPNSSQFESTIISNDEISFIDESSQNQSNHQPRTYTKRKSTRIFKPSVTSPYQCDICGFEIHIKSKFLSHIRLHASSIKHKCKECFETFKSMKSLHQHSMKIHNRGVFGSIDYSKFSSDCEICGKTLSAERMKSHMALHQSPKVVCDHCGKIYRTKMALDRHLSVIMAEKKFTCSICGKNFKKMSILKQHEETHNPIKIYIKCEICAKILQMKHLKMHMEVQHGNRYSEKNFQCHCGKEFRYQKQLDKHNEQVHEAKNRGIFYSCAECERVFTRRQELRNHSFLHYSGPIFECSTCGLKFKKKKLLYIHSRVHNAVGITFDCDECQCKFKTKGGLRKHKIKMHEKN